MLTIKAYYLKNQYCRAAFKAAILIIFAGILSFLAAGIVLADAEPAKPYLQYNEPKEKPAASLFETGSHIFSLLGTFVLVLFLAYITSRLVAKKMSLAAGGKNGKVISVLPLSSGGSGRGVYLVEMAGKYLILGVTEHNINLLQEISDEEEIERIEGIPAASSAKLPSEPFDLIFRRQISSLKDMPQKFPYIFGAPDGGNDDSVSQKEIYKTKNSLTKASEDNREKR